MCEILDLLTYFRSYISADTTPVQCVSHGLYPLIHLSIAKATQKQNALDVWLPFSLICKGVSRMSVASTDLQVRWCKEALTCLFLINQG